MRYFEAKKARVEIIPMIDVMLFLLVFFIIVTLQMIPDSGIAMQLPNSSQAQKLKAPKFVVNILRDGTIQVKKTMMTAPQLTALLANDGDPAKTQLSIAASKDVAFQHFVTVMDAARKAGVSDIGIVAQASNDTATTGGGAPPATGTAVGQSLAPANAVQR